MWLLSLGGVWSIEHKHSSSWRVTTTFLPLRVQGDFCQRSHSDVVVGTGSSGGVQGEWAGHHQYIISYHTPRYEYTSTYPKQDQISLLSEPQFSGHSCKVMQWQNSVVNLVSCGITQDTGIWTWLWSSIPFIDVEIPHTMNGTGSLGWNPRVYEESSHWSLLTDCERDVASCLKLLMP